MMKQTKMLFPLIISMLLLFGMQWCSIVPNLSQQTFNSLKLVLLIHRHGDRNPYSFYPKDPWKDQENWPEGIGYLTLKGKKHMYELGKSLAEFYGKFSIKSPREVDVRSSASPRCLESASLLLSGLFPPTKKWQWNDAGLGQLWQPFPIQTVTFEKDGMLNPDAECPKANQEFERIFNSTSVKNYIKTMASYLELAKNHSGYTEMGLSDASDLFDTLMVEKLQQKTLPEWVTDELYQKLDEISTQFFIFLGSTETMQRLRVGLLLKDVVHRLSSFEKEQKKFYIYSTHDTEISTLLSSLRTFNNIRPSYGATIALEIHQNPSVASGKPFLKALYFNDTLHLGRSHQLTLPECNKLDSSGHGCMVENFKTSIQHLIPENWVEECRI